MSESEQARTPEQIAELYFDCWAKGDPEPLRPCLAPDVSFDGPLASTTGADEFIEGIRGMFAATTGNEVRLRLADNSDVITWSEMRFDDKPPMPVANWTHVEDGRITAVRALFDPRPITGA